jgi:hypothetical protein
VLTGFPMTFFFLQEFKDEQAGRKREYGLFIPGRIFSDNDAFRTFKDKSK